MKDSLQEQLKSVIESGKLNIQEKKPVVEGCRKINATRMFVPLSNHHVLKQFLEFGKNKSHYPDDIPHTFRNYKHFKDKLNKFSAENQATSTIFYISLGYADWAKRMESHNLFRYQFTNLCFELVQLKISGMNEPESPLNCKKICSRSEKYIDNKEFIDRILLHVKIQIRPNICNDNFLTEADRIIESFIQNTPKSWLNITDLENKIMIDTFLLKILTRSIIGLLEKREYTKSDDIFNKYRILSKTEYHRMKTPYLVKDIMRVICTQFSDFEADELISSVLALNKNKFLEKVLSFSRHYILSYDFETGDKVVEAFKQIMPESWNFDDVFEEKLNEFKDTAFRIQLKKNLLDLLKDREYQKADSLFNQSTLLSKSDYDRLKTPYLVKDIIRDICKQSDTNDTDEIISAILDLNKDKFSEKILSFAEHHFYSYDFETGDQIVESFKRIMPDDWNHDEIFEEKIKSLKYKALQKQFKQNLMTLLEERDYRKTDQLFSENDYFSIQEYRQMKMKGVIIDLKNIIEDSCMENDAWKLAAAILEHEPEILYDLTWENIRTFALKILDRVTLPSCVYIDLIRDFSMGLFGLTVSELDILVTQTLEQGHMLPIHEYRYIWKILTDYPEILKKAVSSCREKLDSIARDFPYNRILDIGTIYLPPEKILCHYLITTPVPLHFEIYNQLKQIFEKNRYLNCQMILALLKARNDHHELRINDILDNLKKIVTKAYDYNLEFKTPIPNLIFPKCIDSKNRHRFQISDTNYIFCEGKIGIDQKTGKKYVFCRNRRCDTFSDLIQIECDAWQNNVFFDFLYRIAGVTSADFFSNDNFLRAMGAFNRWNEICHRLICGYDQSTGCGSTLIYSRTPQVKAGWAAYAVTYWRCSNPSCTQKEMTIKITHCRGCGKIIDSRFDKISCSSCGLDQKNDFYICMSCGYCCDDHKVSGFCPDCGQEKTWAVMDDYHKRYQCKCCGREITVPGYLKGCLG